MIHCKRVKEEKTIRSKVLEDLKKKGVIKDNKVLNDNLTNEEKVNKLRERLLQKVNEREQKLKQ